MDIRKLRSSWHQYKVKASLDYLDKEEVLCLMEERGSMAINRSYRLFSSLTIFILLLLCLQSG